MVQPWWGAAVALPVIVVKGVVNGRLKNKKVESEGRNFREEDGNEPSFVCERVCTSDRLLRRLGSLAKVTIPACAMRSSERTDLSVRKLSYVHLTHSSSFDLPMQDPTPNTCVTVCGSSGERGFFTFRYCLLQVDDACFCPFSRRAAVCHDQVMFAKEAAAGSLQLLILQPRALCGIMWNYKHNTFLTSLNNFDLLRWIALAAHSAAVLSHPPVNCYPLPAIIDCLAYL